MRRQFIALLVGASIAVAAVTQAAAQSATASTPAPPPLGLFGLQIGEPLALPACTATGKATDATSAYPTAHGGSNIDCLLQIRDPLLGPYGVVRVSDTVHAANTHLRQDLKVEVQAGKIVSIRIMTATETGPERTLKLLKDLYGPPSSERAESGDGATFKTATAEWRLPTGFIHFTGGAPGYLTGLVEIESVDWHSRPINSIPPPSGSLVATALKPRSRSDPATEAAAAMITSLATDIEMSRLNWLLDLDDKALVEFAPADRPKLIQISNEYISMHDGAKFLLSPTGRMIFSDPKPKPGATAPAPKK